MLCLLGDRKDLISNMYLGLMKIIGIILLVAGYMDIKTKRVSILMLVILGATGVLSLFYKENMVLIDTIGGVMIGISMIGISMISREQIGMGDGIVMTIIGMVTGFRNGLLILCMASLFMAVISVFILILKKGNKKTRLPFIPAIFLGYMTAII